MKTTNQRPSWTHRLIVTAASLAFGGGSLFLTSCHTVQGVGEDVQHVGEEIEDHAEHHH